MRIVALVLGGLLLIGGSALVVVADQQRQAAVEQARQAIADLEQRREQALDDNLALAGALTGLRSTIAEQEEQLGDRDGFLE
jgi:type II secretory pathway component PulJ